MNTSERTIGSSRLQIARGRRLMFVIGSLLILSIVTIIFGDSAFSSWGIEANTGWQLISNGHYTTRVLAGAHTDQSSGTAFVRGGHTLVLDYNVTVKNGSAFVNVYNGLNLSQDALYYQSIEQDRQGHIEIPIKHTSLYHIDTSYYSYAGVIDVRWHVD